MSVLDDEASWCRAQISIIRLEKKVELDKALALAQLLEDEGTISTAALALRVLAKEYKKVLTEKQEMEYEQNTIPRLLTHKDKWDFV